MAEENARVSQAAALHRQAAALTAAAASALEMLAPGAAGLREQHQTTERLRRAAAALTPGWLGAPLEDQSVNTPLGGEAQPAFVRIGVARPLDDASFPAIVPLLGTGHLTVDADARDQRVSGLIRAILVRLLATAPAGSLLVRGVDGTGGAVFAPFSGLTDAGLMPPPVTDRDGLQAVLGEAEHWVRPARSSGSRRPRRERRLLLVVAALPELTEVADLTRLAALAEPGPASGLHLILAGWPPPPVRPGQPDRHLATSTAIALRNPYAIVGDPPGASFAADAHGVGLNSPVFLDEDPPPRLVERVCRELAARAVVDDRPRLGDLLPEASSAGQPLAARVAGGEDGLWAETAAEGLATTVGRDGDRPVTLQLNDLTPHWLVAGRSGAGKTAFLVAVLYGLAARYGPGELAVYLVGNPEGGSFSEFSPTTGDGWWLPHARAVGVTDDRGYGLTVLRDLAAEMGRRAAAAERAGVGRFGQLRAASPDAGESLPRIVCVMDEFAPLVEGADDTATEAIALLEALARNGRACGIHLVLASRSVRSVAALHARDSVFGHFPVRIALPGGGDALEPTNDSAAGLPVGTAVVNTAGGLGGPRGATRGHERTVRFADPYADRVALDELRQRLWKAHESQPAAAGPTRARPGAQRQPRDDDAPPRAALAGTAGQRRTILAPSTQHADDPPDPGQSNGDAPGVAR